MITVRQHLISFAILFEGYLGYSKKKGDQGDLHQLIKSNIFDGDWDEFRANWGPGCTLYDELTKDIKTWEEAFERVQNIAKDLKLKDNQLFSFVELCLELFLYISDYQSVEEFSDIFIGPDINNSHKNYPQFKIFKYLNDGFGGNKVLEYLIQKANPVPEIISKLDPSSKENHVMTISIRGLGSEFSQGVVSLDDRKDFYNNYDNEKEKWDQFCKEQLNLEGYWEVNEIAHVTGLLLDVVELEIIIDDDTAFKGKYWDFMGMFFEDGNENNLNVSTQYGKEIDSLDGEVLATHTTSEVFEIEKSLDSQTPFDIKNIGFMIFSTDEIGYRKDYGDYILDIVYNGQSYDFEFPSGTGQVRDLFFD